jgi:hypothetical protein
MVPGTAGTCTKTGTSSKEIFCEDNENKHESEGNSGISKILSSECSLVVQPCSSHIVLTYCTCNGRKEMGSVICKSEGKNRVQVLLRVATLVLQVPLRAVLPSTTGSTRYFLGCGLWVVGCGLWVVALEARSSKLSSRESCTIVL